MSLVLAARRNPRYVVLAAAIVLVLGLFGLRSTSIPARGSEYVKSILSQSGGWQQHATSSADPEVEEPLNIDPLETEPFGTEPFETEPFESPPFESQPSETRPLSEAEADPEAQYSKDKWFFEYDLHDGAYPRPMFDIEKLAQYPAHNYRGPGHDTFATVFLSRNGSLQDPYFVATQQVLYRLMWDPRSKSDKHPVTVFVPHFVTREQRLIFAAAGALVIEVKQLLFTPNDKTVGLVAARLKDVFSKLEMWNQTDFTRIAYLDSDAFPMDNLDDIFDQAPMQTCKAELVSEADQNLPAELCDYAFSALLETTGMLNAGVMIFKPNEPMYEVLVREYHDNEHFDNGFVEQALLTYVYRADGPFPSSFISKAWNGDAGEKDNGRPLHIFHGKLWALFFDPKHWASSIFIDTWNDMKTLYESDEFVRLREADGRRGMLE